VTPQNPLKSSDKSLNSRIRIESARQAMARHPELDVVVDGIEYEMPSPHYTINTLDALKRREPFNDFTLIIGSDNLASIEQWREYERILTDYGVAVYPRNGYDVKPAMEKLNRPEFRIELLDAPTVDISSTQIRESQSLGIDMSAYLI